MLEKQTIGDFTTNFCGVSVFGAYVLLYLKLDAMTPDELNQYPNYLQMYVFQLIGPYLVVFTISILIYTRHPSLRDELLKEMNDYFHCLV